MNNNWKYELKNNGITRKEAAEYLGLLYSTFCHKLNQFSRFSLEEERCLRNLINSKKNENN